MELQRGIKHPHIYKTGNDLSWDIWGIYFGDHLMKEDATV